jgi:pyrroloquinoline-quinone synthase
MQREEFWNEVEAIASRFNIATHPFVDLVAEGKASSEQLAGFAVEHHEMTVRDAGEYMARGYISMLDIDAEGAALMGENFAEEAMGLFTKTAGHAELLYEFWERGLDRPRQTLLEASASAAARTMNAYFWILMTHKTRYAGCLGLLEGGFSQACERLFEALQTHYGMTPAQLRFFSGHIEADKEHAATGRKIADRLLTSDHDRREFLTEAACIGDLYWKGWDAMIETR